MAFHRTALHKRRCQTEHDKNHQACKPDIGGHCSDPDREVHSNRILEVEPIHIVGKRSNVKRKRSPSPGLDSHAPRRKVESQCSAQSSLCSPGSGVFLTPTKRISPMKLSTPKCLVILPKLLVVTISTSIVRANPFHCRKLRFTRTSTLMEIY